MNRYLFALSIAFVAAFRAASLEAGAAKIEITPPLDTPLNGYGDRLGRGAVSVHDPLWARSLYLNDGKTSVLLVNTDLCLINRELRDRVLELAPAEVPRENIILTATHTHSAQGGMNRSLIVRAVSGRFMPDVLAEVGHDGDPWNLEANCDGLTPSRNARVRTSRPSRSAKLASLSSYFGTSRPARRDGAPLAWSVAI